MGALLAVVIVWIGNTRSVGKVDESTVHSRMKFNVIVKGKNRHISKMPAAEEVGDRSGLQNGPRSRSLIFQKLLK